uniref:RRM domain-containing protein n=1 Tax=Trichuris muris TaxID=70415 RepID=A0A5S6QKJ9_TRIMR
MQMNGKIVSEDVGLSLDEIIKKSGSLFALRGRGGRSRRGRGISIGRRGRFFANRSFNRFRSGGFWSKVVPPGRWQHDRFEGYSGIASVKPSGDGFTLLVSNLGPSVTDSDIKDLFSDVGPLLRSCVHYDRHGQSLGLADVVYARRVDALSAMNRFGSVSLDGRSMELQLVGNQPMARRGLTERLSNATGFRTTGRSLRRGGFRGTRGRGRGRGAAPTEAALDADLDAYMKSN